MAKKKFLSVEDKYFPVTTVPNLSNHVRPKENPAVVKKIIQGAIQGAFHLATPGEYDIKYNKATVVPEEQIQLVVHLIESLEPANAIEAALASQFVISYIQGLKSSQKDGPVYLNTTLRLFEFGHQVLEALQKFRTKGAQLINVQYNHNQGQINNIKVVEVEKGNLKDVMEINA